MEEISREENPVQIVSEETSKRIISLRYLLSVLVVCIHANLTPELANYYHYEFIQPYWIEVCKNFICNILGGAAVPLFFFFASFLQFKKNDTYGELLRKRSKSLLLPYIVWTIITVLLFFISQSIPQTASYFQNPMNIVKNWKGLDWIKIFTFCSDTYPFVGQFWFLRELIIFIILSPILKFLCERVPGIIIIFISVAALKEVPLFFTVSSSAFFFYVAGYFCAVKKIAFFRLSDKIRFYEYILLLVLVVVFDITSGGKYRFGFITTIISCLFFLKLSGYLIKKEKVYKKLEYLSGLSFFLYAVHAPFISGTINKITQRVIPLHGILCLFQFLLASFLTIIIGTLIGILCRKICPRLFNILNGGRK